MTRSSVLPVTPSSAIVTQYQQLQQRRQRRQRRQRGDSDDEMKKIEMKTLRSNVVLMFICFILMCVDQDERLSSQPVLWLAVFFGFRCNCWLVYGASCRSILSFIPGLNFELKKFLTARPSLGGPQPRVNSAHSLASVTSSRS